MRKQPFQTSFPFPGVDMTAKNEKYEFAKKVGVLLDACWKPASAILNGAMSYETWKKRNIKPAQDLVRDGYTPETVAQAMIDSGKYSLHFVLDHVVFERVKQFPGLPPKPHLDPGQTAWYDETVGRWFVENDCDPPTRLELLEQRRQEQ